MLSIDISYIVDEVSRHTFSLRYMKTLCVTLFHSQIFTTLSGIPITYFFSSFFSNTLAAYGLLMITYFTTGVVRNPQDWWQNTTQLS